MLNLRETRQYLKESEFKPLFIEELGWDRHTQILPVTIDENDYLLTAIAQKRGMVVFECAATETEGIPDEEMQRWYISVMLNRLMFIYFIQKKGFLDNDPDYLRNKLTQIQAKGTGRYYKEFLCPLFFEGFAKPEAERSRDVKRLLGKIPYLNGGIFQKHQLETLHGENIEIPDKAFEQLFRFFEKYEWHLDDRPLRNDNEINPDVLGYIFEKYINQKQMGAYYTKEDITEYISKNTIIPFLFDKARTACKIAFEGDINVWQLLQDDPNRYIYDAVKKVWNWSCLQTLLPELTMSPDVTTAGTS